MNKDEARKILQYANAGSPLDEQMQAIIDEPDKPTECKPVAWCWIEGGQMCNGPEVECFEESFVSFDKPEYLVHYLTPLYTSPLTQDEMRQVLEALELGRKTISDLERMNGLFGNDEHRAECTSQLDQIYEAIEILKGNLK